MRLERKKFGNHCSRTCLANLYWDFLDTCPEPMYLESLDLEKWFDIQGFANFTAAHLVAKRHTMNVGQGV